MNQYDYIISKLKGELYCFIINPKTGERLRSDYLFTIDDINNHFLINPEFSRSDVIVEEETFDEWVNRLEDK